MVREMYAAQRVQLNLAIMAASYPYMSEHNQRSVQAKLQGPAEVDDGVERENMQMIDNLRMRARMEGAKVAPTQPIEAPDDSLVRETIAKLRVPGEGA